MTDSGTISNYPVNSAYPFVLSLSDLKLKVNLGVEINERSTPQEIELNFKLFFKVPPVAFESDKIADTICYHELSDKICEILVRQEYRLIEHICGAVFKVMRDYVPDDIKIWLKVIKWPDYKGFKAISACEYSDL